MKIFAKKCRRRHYLSGVVLNDSGIVCIVELPEVHLAELQRLRQHVEGRLLLLWHCGLQNGISS